MSRSKSPGSEKRDPGNPDATAKCSRKTQWENGSRYATWPGGQQEICNKTAVKTNKRTVIVTQEEKAFLDQSTLRNRNNCFYPWQKGMKVTAPKDKPQNTRQIQIWKNARWGSGVKPPAMKPTLVTLYEAIKETQNKLFLVHLKPQGSTTFVWGLAQVNQEDTNPYRARKKGIYRCHWRGPHPDDTKYKSARDSRFWPVVHRIDGLDFLTEQHVVSPDKVHGLLDRRDDLGWYQLNVDDGMIRLTLPFDFSTVQVGKRTERWRIGNTWRYDMIEEAGKRDVPTDDVDRKPRPRHTRARSGGRRRERGREGAAMKPYCRNIGTQLLVQFIIVGRSKRVHLTPGVVSKFN